MSFVVVLHTIVGRRNPFDLHHDQCAQGQGRNLDHELLNQLQRACIHP